RSFARIGTVTTEGGAEIPGVRLAYETFGELNERRDNAILVFHALTGDSHLVGDAGPGHPTDGRWSEVVGPGRALDTDRYCIVAPNVLGGCQGSTGPASLAPDHTEWGGRFPYLTIRDQVAAAGAFADVLGIERFVAVIGGSVGGMHALEWGLMHPERA